MNKTLAVLAEAGQSIWLDNIHRTMLASGELRALVDDGVTGVTSNPTIFEKAINQSDAYDARIRELSAAGADSWAIYDDLTRSDVAAAADQLRSVYDRTEGRDGYVSIEVNPKLAYDTHATLAEARRLFRVLDRPNIMVKIPGTAEGLPAIEAALADGINVNVTLIFAVEAYEQIMHAYRRGIEQALAAGRDASRIASVASFFVSRVDSAVDQAIAGRADLADLAGRAAVANSKLAYARFEEVFAEPAFKALSTKGAALQRPLWASTSTKNPAYSPTLYVDTLVGPHTVNTMPPATLEAVRSGMPVCVTVTQGVDEAQAIVDRLASAGIAMQRVTDELRRAGVDAFIASFEKLMDSIEQKRSALIDG